MLSQTYQRVKFDLERPSLTKYESKPPEEPMMSLKHTAKRSLLLIFNVLKIESILVVCIADPRKRASNAYRQSNACNNADEKQYIWIALAVFEYQRYVEDEPRKTRCRATRMDSTEMLQGGGTSTTEPQGGPLDRQNA